MKIIAGIFEGERVEAKIIEKLASLPSKDVMRAKLLLLLQGPQRRFLSLVQAVPQELLGTLQALAKDKEEAAPEQTDAKD